MLINRQLFQTNIYAFGGVEMGEGNLEEFRFLENLVNPNRVWSRRLTLCCVSLDS